MEEAHPCSLQPQLPARCLSPHPVFQRQPTTPHFQTNVCFCVPASEHAVRLLGIPSPTFLTKSAGHARRHRVRGHLLSRLPPTPPLGPSRAGLHPVGLSPRVSREQRVFSKCRLKVQMLSALPQPLHYFTIFMLSRLPCLFGPHHQCRLPSGCQNLPVLLVQQSQKCLQGFVPGAPAPLS